MIRSFADKRTRRLFETGEGGTLPPDIIRRALRKLDYLEAATRLEDLRAPRSNRLHALSGSRAGQFAIAINNQWRLCFRFDAGDVFEVEICDYH